MIKSVLIVICLALVITLCGLHGCGSEPVAITNGTPIYSVSEVAGSLKRVKFDGHIYIVRSQGYQGGICHDPDCHCLTPLERK